MFLLVRAVYVAFGLVVREGSNHFDFRLSKARDTPQWVSNPLGLRIN